MAKLAQIVKVIGWESKELKRLEQFQISNSKLEVEHFCIIEHHDRMRDGRSYSKGTTASARLLRVGIVEDESATRQAILVIQTRADKKEIGLGIDENADAETLEDLIRLLGRLSKAHGIAVSGTAAALDSDSQASRIRRQLFPLDELLQLARRLVADLNRHLLLLFFNRPELQDRDGRL